MKKTLVIKLDSRAQKSVELENQIISAMRSIGLDYDGCDFGFEADYNRRLFFITNRNFDVEVIDNSDDTDDDLPPNE